MTSSPRLTPFDLTFPDREKAGLILDAIASEGDSRGVDLSYPSSFLQLGEVGLALQEIQGGGRGREAIQGLGALLFHLFHFRRGGERILVLDRDEAASIVGDRYNSSGKTVWGGDLPLEAGYLQLPRHLFWTEGEGESPAEAIDGIFWTASTGGTLSLVMVSGIMEGRPGFTIFESPPVPLADAPRWPELRVRDSGEDFQTTLPGGDLAGLHSIVAFGEVLKLLGRVFSSRVEETP